MSQIIVKVLITTVLVVVISEVARRSTFIGGLIASIPVTSVLAIVWLYADERDPAKVAQLSTSILWLVIPSLLFFVVLPMLLRRNVGFALSMGVSGLATAAGYFAMVFGLARLGVRL